MHKESVPSNLLVFADFHFNGEEKYSTSAELKTKSRFCSTVRGEKHVDYTPRGVIFSKNRDITRKSHNFNQPFVFKRLIKIMGLTRDVRHPREDYYLSSPDKLIETHILSQFNYGNIIFKIQLNNYKRKLQNVTFLRTNNSRTLNENTDLVAWNLTRVCLK